MEHSDQINHFIQNVRQEVNMEMGDAATSRKILSSSEEFMDTSDECDQVIEPCTIVGNLQQQQGVVTHEDQADQIIKDAEKAKANMYELKGKPTVGNFLNTRNFSDCSVTRMDEDYQMLDSHVDEILHKKILDFEYVDFSKLIAKNKPFNDQDQCLEIVNRNGMTFLVPLADRELISD